MDPLHMHRQLLNPATYPETTRRVEFRETHISRVYLTDTHAYKLKKPLNLGFLDFSTLERRGFFCAEEVRLNRRFAPGTYLGVVELHEDQGRLRFGGPGRLLEFAVQMRRLPEARMLDHLLDTAASELPAEIERLARHLAPLLATAEVCRAAGKGSQVAVITANCAENLAQTVPAIGQGLSAEAHRVMTRLSRGQIDQLSPLFAAREARGYVRDGHGDLHARNICMTDPIQIYDCIEFCRRFRVADVAAELAFLLMDLDFRGRRDLAGRLLAAYLECADDPELTQLLGFYKSYRAWVRGKVDALLAGEAEVDAAMRAEAQLRSRRYFNLALGYHVPATLLLTAGLMGVGKTTLARALAAAVGGTLLRSDVVRKELAGIAPTTSRLEPFGAGLYAPAMHARTYAELGRRAQALLASGTTVIVDASFARTAERQAFLAMADARGIPAWLLHLQCDRATALTRLDRRQVEGHDASDGRSDLAQAQAARFEPLPAGPRVIEIDSSAAVDYNVQKIICRLLAG
jgi:aminoglycoside phosphotransferase family enzyme/gluconate kinase